MKKILLSMGIFLSALGIQAQNVNIPDANFKAALLQANVDANLDGIIQLSEAKAVTVLNIDNKSINSLAGIESFTSLKVLNCGFNNLGYLDLSKNKALDSLWINNAGLVALNISGTLSLKFLSCHSNPKLTKICISLAQKVLIVSWIKDPKVVFATDCTSTIGNDIIDAATKKEVIGIYNHLGQEVPASSVSDGSVYIYKYSDGTFSRIARF